MFIKQKIQDISSRLRKKKEIIFFFYEDIEKKFYIK